MNADERLAIFQRALVDIEQSLQERRPPYQDPRTWAERKIAGALYIVREAFMTESLITRLDETKG